VPKTFTHKGLEIPVLDTIYKDGKRYYITPSGNLYPSVSTVMGSLSKDSISAWRARVGEEEANKISNYATTFGTAIHKIIEDYINNEPTYLESAMPQQKWVVAAATQTLDRIDNVYCQEACLYSDVLCLAGRTDCIAEFDGVPSVIDFKTARKMKTESMIESYFLQATCYSLMFEEITGIKIPQLVILMMTYEGQVAVFKKQRKDYYSRLKEVLLDVRRNQISN
jgi:genome maintenance exonuclease 1